MNSDTINNEKLEVINFKLNLKLSKYLRELKNYYEIGSNTEMIRFLIAESHRKMIREKRELGLKDQDLIE